LAEQRYLLLKIRHFDCLVIKLLDSIPNKGVSSVDWSELFPERLSWRDWIGRKIVPIVGTGCYVLVVVVVFSIVAYMVILENI
jgi:hypothetical protein